MANVDLSVRVLMGLGLLEVVPFVLNIVLVKIIFNNVFKVIKSFPMNLTHSLTFIYIQVDPSSINLKNIPQTYNKAEIARFYSENPTVYIGRFFEILAISKDLLYGLLTDSFDSNQRNAEEEIR